MTARSHRVGRRRGAARQPAQLRHFVSPRWAGEAALPGPPLWWLDKVLFLTSGTIVTGGVSRTQTASFNAFGFVTNLTTNGSSQGFSEVSGTNRISGASYNAAGSMTGWGGYSYTWDPLNQMASVFGGSMTKRTFLYTADHGCHVSLYDLASRNVAM